MVKIYSTPVVEQITFTSESILCTSTLELKPNSTEKLFEEIGTW